MTLSGILAPCSAALTVALRLNWGERRTAKCTVSYNVIHVTAFKQNGSLGSGKKRGFLHILGEPSRLSTHKYILIQDFFMASSLLAKVCFG